MELEWFYKLLIDTLSFPAFTLALVATVGLVALKKTKSEVLTGFFKTFIAVVTIVAGAVTVVNALLPLNSLLVKAFKFAGVYTLEEVTTGAALPYLGAEIGAIFGLGFFIHLILCRIIPKGLRAFKHVYLTGHVMWTMAGMLALVHNNFGFTGTTAIISGGIMLGVYLTVSCALVWRFIEPITGGRFGFGHTQSFGIFVSGWLAKLLGNPKNDAEKVAFPKGLEFLKVPSIITALMMILIYFLAAVAVGPAVVEAQFSGGQNFIVYCLSNAIFFAAGIEIIMTGVRMFIGEIIPAFKGISDVVIPGAIPGLDCPAIYPFAPTSLMIGVVFGIIFTLGSTFVQATMGFPMVILPNAIYAFFVGASTGVVANKAGGLRGVIIASVFSGIWYMFYPLYFLPFLGLDKLGLTGLSMSADCAAWGTFFGLILAFITGKPI